MSEKETEPEKTFSVISLAGILILAFLAGAYIMHSKIFPAYLLHDAFVGGDALFEKAATNAGTALKVNMWHVPRFKESGTTVWNREKAYNGYTVITNAGFSGAWLLDMEGKVAHEWKLFFRTAWPNPTHVSMPVKEELIYWRRAWLYPNGDILANFEANGDTPWGYGLVKVDKNSKIIWKYPQRVHHDIWVDDEGKIYTLTHEIINNPAPDLQFLQRPYLNDFLVILSPEGKELERIEIMDAFQRSDFMSSIYSLNARVHYAGDFLHTNTVKVIDDRLAGKLPFLKKGHILLSLRSLSLICLLDPVEKKIVWTQSGMWLFQHDPEFTENGTVFIFDNLGDYLKNNTSRVLEYDPVQMKILWQWAGTKERPLYSQLRGFKQLLPNGNILVTEDDNGRLIEVTRDKQVVWEYLNPVKKTENGVEKIAVISGGRRFTREQLPFLDEKQPN